MLSSRTYLFNLDHAILFVFKLGIGREMLEIEIAIASTMCKCRRRGDTSKKPDRPPKNRAMMIHSMIRFDSTSSTLIPFYVGSTHEELVGRRDQFTYATRAFWRPTRQPLIFYHVAC